MRLILGLDVRERIVQKGLDLLRLLKLELLKTLAVLGSEGRPRDVQVFAKVELDLISRVLEEGIKGDDVRVGSGCLTVKSTIRSRISKSGPLLKL